VDPEIPAAVRALWQSLQASSESLLALRKDADTQAAYDKSDEEVQGAQRLSLLLIQHLISMLRKCVKEPKVFEQAVACCHLLDSILTVTTSVRMQPAASELLRLGETLNVCLLWCQCVATCHLDTDKALLDRVLQPSCSHVVHSVLLACCHIRRQHCLFQHRCYAIAGSHARDKQSPEPGCVFCAFPHDS